MLELEEYIYVCGQSSSQDRRHCRVGSSGRRVCGLREFQFRRIVGYQQFWGTGEDAQRSREVAAAKAFLKDYSKPPTRISQTQALPSAPPQGKTFVWLNCSLPACTSVGSGIKAAVSAAGWKYQQINYDRANPASLVAAFKQALTTQPTAVGVTGVPPEAGWSSVLPAYKAAGVAIVVCGLGPTELNSPLIANVGGPPNFARFAKLIANWFIADSNGEGKALIQRVDALPVLKFYADTLVAEIKAGCSDCDVSTVQNTYAQVGANAVVPATVSALKRDPSIEYLLPSALDFFDSLPSALAAANIKVKVAGGASARTPALIKSGDYAAASTHPLEQMGWVMVDAAFRFAMGLPIPAEDNGPLPTWLLTASGDFPTDELLEYPTDYQSQFKTLWKVE
jgi:ribose transport system substrate-binding protein